MSSPQPPEDPEYTSEPKVLSPVSPKPLHYPTPDNIPILQNQIDPHFNQMDTHINGAASSGDTTSAQAGTDDGAVGDVLAQDGQNAVNGDTNGTAVPVDAQANPDNALANGQTATNTDHLASSSNVLTNEPSTGHEPNVPTVQDLTRLQSIIPSQSNPPGTSNPHDLPGALQDPGANIPDYQALLNSLSKPPPSTNLDPPPSYIPLDDSAPPTNPPAPGTSTAPAGLPPRPPPQAQPSIHPNYSQTSDIRQYHPHPTNAQPAPGSSFALNATGLPPPPVASFQQPPPSATQSTPQMSPSQASFGGQLSRDGRNSLGGLEGADDQVPWSAETKRLYEVFLEQERDYVTEGNWEQFPYGSRLFVGRILQKSCSRRFELT